MLAIHRTIIRADEWVTVPWRNGLGETHEVYPGRVAKAALPGLQLHVTPISQAAPFSLYAGFDRILFVLEGSALVMSIDTREVTVARGEAMRFSGEAVVKAWPESGSVTVFNVIYARDHWREVTEKDGSAALSIIHALEQLQLDADTLIAPRDTFIGAARPGATGDARGALSVTLAAS